MLHYSSAEYNKLINLRKKIVGTCKFCDGQGYHLANDGISTPCTCMIVFKYIKQLTVAAIPSKYWTLTLEQLSIRDTYKKLLQRYIDNLQTAFEKNLGFLFAGTNGVGKTASMIEIAKEAIIHGYSVLYFTAEQYITAIGKNETAFLERLEQASFLFLDELDKAYIKDGSSYAPKKLEDLIRSSHSRGKAVSLATNMDLEMLTETFGDSFMSMLQRYLKHVPFDGEDYSSTLQKNWMHDLQHAYNYNDQIIIAAALKRKEVCNGDY